MNLSISADIRMPEIKRKFFYKNTVMLTLTIHYPKIWLGSNRKAQIRINRQIQNQVNKYLKYASTTLYRNAVKEYYDALKNGFPFRPYEAFMQYEVTYNYNCYLSSYHDKYEYTGGAHGNTIRTSDTWSLKTGTRLSLSSYFRSGENYRKLFIDQILLQADQDHSNYFDDYHTLIIQNFNADNYFLSEEGFNIYYQQYEIAPYSTGIVVFTIPYSVVGWYPSC